MWGKRMRILIYGMTEQFGGVEKFLLERISALIKIGYDIDVTFSDGAVVEYEEKLREHGIQIQRIARLSNPIAYYKSLVKLIKHGRYDLLYCNIGFNNAILYKAAKRGGAKLLVHSHNTDVDAPSILKRYILKTYHYISKLAASNLIDYRFACSKDAGEWLFRTGDTYHVVHNAIDVFQFRFNNDIRVKMRQELNLQNHFVVGHVGRLSYQKNQTFLLKIFKEILKLKHNSELLIIGQGEDLPVLRVLALKLGCADKVHFLGHRDDVNYLMQAMDCFVLPSCFEGLALAGIEAQAASLPAFFSDKIPAEAGVSSLAHFISLNEEPIYWAQAILDASNCPRTDVSGIIKMSGYDLTTEIKKFIMLFRYIEGDTKHD